jgi:uncharacterized repeat protein (TIGR03806 family)
MNKLVLFLLSFVVVSLTSCGGDDDSIMTSDDQGFVPLEITTTEDIVQVSTLQTIAISVFANDTNIPKEGRVTFSSPTNGEITLDTNATPDDVRDDFIIYDPNDNYVGNDTLTYTICLEDGSNCKTETISITVFQDTTVTVDLSRFPYNTLSEYNFFDGLLNAVEPAYGVLPYEPISGLFTDYAIKKRYVWVPVGQKATYNADNKSLDFPTGSALIKVFYYDNVQNVNPPNARRIIETRVMIKLDSGWDFAEYVWNDEQTEAFLEATGDGGFTEVEWLQDGEPKFVNYRIPARTQCIICHSNNGEHIPIGIKPQNINSNYPFEDGNFNQLQKLIDFGYLEDNLPASINTVVNWEDVSQPLDLRAKSYLDINCGNCHVAGGQGDYRRIRLSYTDTQNNDENVGICVDADTPIPGLVGQKYIAPMDVANSIVYFRMNIEGDGQYKMPQFGQSLVHTEAMELMEEWINSLNQSCD